MNGARAQRLGPDATPRAMSDLRVGSMFSGVGALDLAALSVFGGRIAWHSEIDPAGCKVLAAHWPGVPNLGDVSAIDWSEAPRVDVLTAGFPCQDLSLAGRRAGIRPGTRSGLWAHVAYAIDQLHPSLVVIENVRGLLSADAACDLEPCPWCVGDDEGRPLRALGRLLGDLADRGYDARWCGLRAADVGAPHGRFRVFVTAWPAADPAGIRRRIEGRDDRLRAEGLVSVAAPDADELGPVRAGHARRRGAGPAHGGKPAADPQGVGWGERRPEPARLGGGSDASQHGDAATHACGDGREGHAERNLGPQGGQPAPLGGDTAGRVLDWAGYTPAIQRWERALGRRAPAPTVLGRRGGRQLSALFVEFLMGLPEGHVTAVPGLSRNEQLKLLGNGVVPQQAAAALRHLLAARSECAA